MSAVELKGTKIKGGILTPQKKKSTFYFYFFSLPVNTHVHTCSANRDPFASMLQREIDNGREVLCHLLPEKCNEKRHKIRRV